MSEEGMPQHWCDLTLDQQEALLELAESRVFWKNLWSRLGWLKQFGAVMLTLAAALTLMRDGLIHFLQGLSR